MNVLAALWMLLQCVISWEPCDISQFWIEPNTLSQIDFEYRQDEESTAKPTMFKVKTTDGDLLAEGEGRIEENRLRIEMKLPQGYFELELPDSNQVFGIASQPAFCPDDSLLKLEAVGRNDIRSRDSFFAIDSASTWLVANEKICEAMIRNARRIGIASYRERVNWRRIEPNVNEFVFDGDNHSEFIRETAKKYDMPLLEMFHNAPDWAGHRGKFPVDLIKTAESWGIIGQHWNTAWNSFEVWNEPDISFSGNLPADQYIPILKTVAQEFNRKGIETPIVGGIIASFRNDYMDVLADNGILDACDVFSFHTYCRATEMSAVCMKYHDWLVKNHAEWKPLWITECGRPWKKGTDRPNREADLLSAIDIVQKGVVAKSIGCDAYYPFVYVYYEENGYNFGMNDKNNAPLRSIAGYARMIYLLSGKECIGSWLLDGVDSSWVFNDKETGEKIAVLYSEHSERGRKLQLPCKVSFVERVTGECVTISEDGFVDFSDGLLFVSLPSDSTLQFSDPSDVDNVRLLRRVARETYGIQPRHNYETVLRFDYDEDSLEVLNDGYSLNEGASESEFHGVISVFNFSDEEKCLPFSAEAAFLNNDGTREKVDVFIELPELVSIPARDVAIVNFTIDVTKITPMLPLVLSFKAGEEGWLSFRFSRCFTEENFQMYSERCVRIPLGERSSWTKNCSPSGSIEFPSEPKTDFLRECEYKVHFGEDGDRWAYPRFELPVTDDLKLVDPEGGEPVKMTDFKGVAFHVRATSNEPGGCVRFFTFSPKGNYYYTAQELTPIDGKERFVVIPFRSLTAYGGTPDAFSANNITGISVGVNSAGSETSVEIKDFFFFK